MALVLSVFLILCWHLLSNQQQFAIGGSIAFVLIITFIIGCVLMWVACMVVVFQWFFGIE